MKVREIPIKFSCGCPNGKHKCSMRKIIEKGKNEKTDKMYEVEVEVEDEKYLFSSKPIPKLQKTEKRIKN